nr:PREDICTED: uncharacterized protein LOC109044172 isoform X5 [Bemisia tabaci]
MECYSLHSHFKKYLMNRLGPRKNVYNVASGLISEHESTSSESKSKKTYIRYDTYRPSIFANDKNEPRGRRFKKSEQPKSAKLSIIERKLKVKSKTAPQSETAHILPSTDDSNAETDVTPELTRSISEISIVSAEEKKGEVRGCTRWYVDDHPKVTDLDEEESEPDLPDGKPGLPDVKPGLPDLKPDLPDAKSNLPDGKPDRPVERGALATILREKRRQAGSASSKEGTGNFGPSSTSIEDADSLGSEGSVVKEDSGSVEGRGPRVPDRGKCARRKIRRRPRLERRSVASSDSSTGFENRPRRPVKNGLRRVSAVHESRLSRIVNSQACPLNSDELEDQLVRVLEKNSELTIQNTDLQKLVQQLQNVKGGTGISLNANENLSHILKLMRDASDKRKEYETERAEALLALQDLQRKSTTSLEKAKNYELMEALQSKIRELEKKTELQNVRHEELLLELRAIKKSEGKSTTDDVTSDGSWKRSSTNQEIQTSPDSNTSTPELNDRLSRPNTAHEYSDHQWPTKHRSHHSSGNPLQHSSAASANVNVVDALSAFVNPNLQFPLNPGMLYWPTVDMLTGMSIGSYVDNCSAPVSSSGGSSSGSGGHNPQSHHYHSSSNQTNITSEIDRIMAKIDQDNRILAELDKTRSTIGLPTSSGTMSSLALGDTAQQLGAHNNAIGMPLMAAQTIPISALTQSGIINPLLSTANPSTAAAYQLMLNSTVSLGQPSNTMLPSLVHPHRVMPQIPTMLASQIDLDRPFVDPSSLSDSKQPDMLDIPGKGRCFVYIARYTYDPFTHSPNECPEAELPINAGDYLLVWGNMDEDGFFDGELLDGRRGLVPSNYVEKLVGDDLLEFHQSVVVGLRESDESGSTTIPQDLEYINCADDYGKRSAIDYNLGGTLEEDDEDDLQPGESPDYFFSLLVPAPKQLTLERQLNKSILIGWNPPENINPSSIESYHVYVDGVLKTTVKATERTRALVEGVDSNRPHRISVRSVTLNRRTSRDAACTMVIGKDIPLGPTCVRASHLTSTSAVISWLPSNSNHQHTVCVNSVEVRTVKPGVYRHTITGLAPNTLYRVSVRAKNIRAPHFDDKASIPVEKFSCHIDFRTLPKGCKGLPEPPIDIQVESGPQDGTLLVTWLPVTANNSTNTALVTGYAVYADGKKVTDVDSPTGDHALIDINKLIGLNPKQVTVRTKSRDNQSSDSAPTPIPTSILKGERQSKDRPMDDRRRYGSAVPPHMRHHQPQRNAHGQIIIDPEENLSDKEIYPGTQMIPSIEITKDTASEGNFSEDDYLDRRRQQKGHYAPPQGNHPPFYEGGHSHHHQRPPRSHAERGRPPQPPMPHERPRPLRPRDERDQFYMGGGGREDPRRRDGPSGSYRGRGGPAGGGPWPPQNAPQNHPRDQRIRYFEALFDYDPQTMSPNPDACDEELPFLRGDTIKVFGEKDNDGFYWGECRGRRGYVPHNMVADMQDVSKNADGRNKDRWGDIYANMPVKRMVAMYDYDPQELSPNVDAEQVELSFQTGNIIYVYGDMDDDGFYMGELDGVRGLVPSNFLTEAPPDYNNGSGPMKGPLPRGHPKAGPPERGHGPGVRGPPPPPREGVPRDPRDRRKDASAQQYDHTKDRMENMKGPKNEQLDRRGGRMDGRGPPPDPHQGAQEYPADQSSKPLSQNPMKGTPKVVPDFVIPNNKESPTTTQPSSKFPGIPETPNLMQKLSEMTSNVTGGGDNSVDHILSKGKELIFMKFGLGK